MDEQDSMNDNLMFDGMIIRASVIFGSLWAVVDDAAKASGHTCPTCISRAYGKQDTITYDIRQQEGSQRIVFVGLAGVSALCCTSPDHKKAKRFFEWYQERLEAPQ